MYNDDEIKNDNPILGNTKPTRSGVQNAPVNFSCYNENYRGVDGVILPNNLTKAKYDKMMEENSGEVKVFNVGKDCLERYKSYTRECKRNKVKPITLNDFYEMEAK